MSTTGEPTGSTAAKLIKNLTLPILAFLAFWRLHITARMLAAAASLVLYKLIGDLAKRWWALSSPRIVEWLDLKLLTLLRGPGYRRRYYRKFIVPESRDFDVKGLATQGYYTLELDQIFIDLNLHESPVSPTRDGSILSQAPANAVQELNGDAEDKTIWKCLKQTCQDRRHYAVIGPPGVGKTTLLKHISLVLAKVKKRRRQLGMPDWIPVLLYLRDHVKRIQDDQEAPISELIRASLPHKLRKAEPPGWFDRQLERGNCVVMLDGLDEVADPGTRKQVVSWLHKQIKQNFDNVFIMTSRPHGYPTNDLQVTTLEIRLFSEKQTESFVKNWYLATEVRRANTKDEETRRKALKAAKDLLRRLRNSPHLFELSANPLLLTMIANVHAYRGTLPKHRAELYAEVLDVFLSRRQEARGLSSELTSSQKQFVLQELAYSLMQDRRRSAGSKEAEQIIQEPLERINMAPQDARNFIDSIENTSGLLLRSQGQVRFAHPTFQEFLAAEHVRERGLVSELLDKTEDGWWQETIRLYAARADPTPVIEACLNSRSTPAIVLAVECEEEAVQVRPDVRQLLNSTITRCVEYTDNDQDRRILSKAQLMLRLRDMDRIKGHIWARPSLLTNTEYKIFVDDCSGGGTAWKQVTLRVPGSGDGPVAIAVISSSDVRAFFAWLNRTAGRAWRYRPPRKHELDEAMRLQCKNDSVWGYWTTDGQELVVEPCMRPPFKWELQEALIWADISYGIPKIIDANRHCIVCRRVDRQFREYELDFVKPIPHPSEWEREEWAQELTAEFSFSGGSIPRAYPLLLAICFFKLGRLPNCDTVRLSTSPPQHTAYVNIRALDTLVQQLKFTLARIGHIDIDIIVERIGDLLNALPKLFEPNLYINDRRYNLILQLVENVREALVGTLSSMRSKALISNHDELRWRIRMSCLFLAYEAIVIDSCDKPNVNGSSPDLEPREVSKGFLDMYASLALLEQRLKGKLPWTEGIRIMKEPSRESQNPVTRGRPPTESAASVP